jgi:magnesium chelatase family protein
MIERYVSKISGPLMVSNRHPHRRAGGELQRACSKFGAGRFRHNSTTRPAREGSTTQPLWRSRRTDLLQCTDGGPRQIRNHCELFSDSERLLERAMQQQGLSARAYDRILKVARTIADLDNTPEI